MKKLISVLVMISVLLSLFAGCGQKSVEEKQSEVNSTTTTTTTTTASRQTDKEETYYAPNNFAILGNGDHYEIEWHDDNSLKITVLGYATPGYPYYDVKINEHGEVISIVENNMYTNEDGNKVAAQGDYRLIPQYDKEHRLIETLERDSDTNEVSSNRKYYYNDEGLRVKTTITGYEGKYDTSFEYKDGLLVKSTHKDFEPNGGDRIYQYKYDKNEEGYITNIYCNISITGEAEDDDWMKQQSLSYEKVTKAQYDFFYNTLIYHIIDKNESIL